MKQLCLTLFLLMGGMFANASSLLSFTHSNPENNSEITSFEDIRVFFNMAEVIEGEGSEGEWGIGYFGSYNAKPKRHRGAILYKGDADSGELLSQIDGSIYGNSEEFVAGRDYISLSFPGIEVESGQTYTIVITYEVFVTKVSGGELGTNALKDNPVTLTFTGADNVKKALSVESCSLSDSDNFEKIEDIYLQFNHNIGIKDNIDACIIEDNNILVSCISCNQSENNLTIKFPETKLYKGHNYHLVIPAESIYIEDNPDIYNPEINIPFEGASYNLFGYSRVIPRPGVATLLDEIQIIFDFPAGYGFVYVDNDATYPLTVYKGEALEANLLGTVKDDGVTSDSKGLIYHPDFDWEAGQTYTFVMDEDVVKAYEIGATRPTYLKDYKCERIEIAFNTPAVEDIPKVTVASAAASEPLDKLSTLGFSIPLTKYEFNDTEYKVTTLGSYVEVPLYEVASNGAEKKIGTYFFDVRTTTDGSSILNFQGSNTGAPMDFALDNDKDYRFDFPANYVGANQKLLKKYSGNEPFSFVIKGTAATSFDITYQITDGGSMTTTVAKGSTPTFKVVAPQDWKVESVKFNGEDVELVNDEYTTPAIEADATVEVEYAYAEEIQFLDLVSSIEDIDIDGSNYSVGKDGEYVVVNNVANGDVITVYTVGGMLIANHVANRDIVKIQLPAGIYIIRVNNVTFKIQH